MVLLLDADSWNRFRLRWARWASVSSCHLLSHETGFRMLIHVSRGFFSGCYISDAWISPRLIRACELGDLLFVVGFSAMLIDGRFNDNKKRRTVRGDQQTRENVWPQGTAFRQTRTVSRRLRRRFWSILPARLCVTGDPSQTSAIGASSRWRRWSRPLGWSSWCCFCRAPSPTASRRKRSLEVITYMWRFYVGGCPTPPAAQPLHRCRSKTGKGE